METIELYRGEKARFNVTCTNAGAAVDLTGATLRMAVMPTGAYPAGGTTDDSGALIVKTVGSGLTLTDPTHGVFTIAFEANDTRAYVFPTGKNYADLPFGVEVEFVGDSSPRTLMQGYIHLVPDVVRGL